MVQEVTLGLKRSQTRTAMKMGTVTTRVLTVHTAKLGPPEGLTPRPPPFSQLGQRALRPEAAQRGQVGCPGHTALQRQC